MNSPPCPFCPPDDSNVFLRTDLAVGIWDRHPVSDGHALIIPRRHIVTWFDTSPDEEVALMAAVRHARDAIEERHTPDGYNIGINSDRAAGQTVGHLHVHVIPRYAGDREDPRGGIRWVLPEKAAYWDVK